MSSNRLSLDKLSSLEGYTPTVFFLTCSLVLVFLALYSLVYKSHKAWKVLLNFFYTFQSFGHLIVFEEWVLSYQAINLLNVSTYVTLV